MPALGWQSRLYRAASHLIPLAGPAILRRRLARGKEIEGRSQEKLGKSTIARPEGPLVWMHAVGLGEVMALRGLIEAMQAERPELSFLVTSTARSSAMAFKSEAMPRTIHQFLPLDAPRFIRRFLAHWRPGLSIWAEQDLWPTAVYETHLQDVPLAMVNARMNRQSFDRRDRFAGVYRDALQCFSLISAQDEETATNLARLGAKAVEVGGPLKAAATPLAVDDGVWAELDRARGARRVWLAASSHAEDEAIALAAQVGRTGDVLVVVPRQIDRADEVCAAAEALGLKAGKWSERVPFGEIDVVIGDSFGDMGLWYRLADRALIGGTFGETEGHNPWEAAALGCAVLHGPRIGNFAVDYDRLRTAGAARQVDAQTLAAALDADLTAERQAASALVASAREGLRPLAVRLCDMVQT